MLLLRQRELLLIGVLVVWTPYVRNHDERTSLRLDVEPGWLRMSLWHRTALSRYFLSLPSCLRPISRLICLFLVFAQSSQVSSTPAAEGHLGGRNRDYFPGQNAIGLLSCDILSAESTLHA